MWVFRSRYSAAPQPPLSLVCLASGWEAHLLQSKVLGLVDRPSLQ